MINASVAIQVLPSVDTCKVIPVVDKVIAYIKSTGLNVYVAPFETTVEGDFNQLMEMVKRCLEICIEEGAPSVMSYIKVQYKPEGGIWTIDEKVSKHHE